MKKIKSRKCQIKVNKEKNLQKTNHQIDVLQGSDLEVLKLLRVRVGHLAAVDDVRDA